MLSLIFRFTGKYKKETIITPILTVIECIFDVLIPYVMSKIIDIGIKGADGANINYVINMGLIMIGLST